MKFSFVVPAFNEEKNIPSLYEKIINLMKNIEGDWELIFINDGSRDNTANVLKNLTSQDKRVKYIGLSRNFGHQIALTAGLHNAKGNAIISLDCDLQDPPEIIEKMIEKWQKGNEIVYARRLNYRKDNFLKKILSKLFYFLMGKFASVNIPRNVGDFRLIDECVLLELNQMPEHFRYLRGMVAWTGFKHDFVDYFRPDRAEGESGYSFGKLFNLAMSGMLNFSTLPLRFGLILGIFSIILGTGLFTYQLVDFLSTGAYYHLHKWLIVIIFVFLGFLFILIWIIGEYIGKIYDEVRQRPIYIVKEKINFD